jgi:hypothetical protein
LAQSVYFIDDPFISLRFAANLVDFGELTFNRGERVEGYSNLLYVLIHTLVFLVRGTVPDAAQAIDVAALLCLHASGAELAVLCVLARTAGDEQTRSAWWLAAVLTCACWPFAFWAVAGMETPLEGLLYVSSVAAIASLAVPGTGAGPLVTLAFLFAGIVLLRFEGALVVLPVTALVALWLWRQKRTRVALGFVSAILIGIALYHISRTLYFGAFLPNTYVAKATGGSAVHRVLSGLSYTLAWIAAQLGVAALLVLALAPGRSDRSLRQWVEHGLERPAELSAIVLLTSKLALVSWGGGDWMPGWRMLLPTAPFAFFLVGRVLASVASTARTGQLGQWLAALCVMVALVLVSRPGLATFGAPDAAGDEVGQLRKLPRGYVEMGALLERAFGAKAAEVAVGEAGLIPYVARSVRFMDLFGLVDRDMARQPGGMHQRVHITHFLERAPTAVVMAHLHRSPPFGQYQYGRELLTSARFHAAYRRIQIGREQDEAGWAVYLRSSLSAPDFELAWVGDDPLRAMTMRRPQ